jgi:predicted acylesterase/phospholipase RssA
MTGTIYAAGFDPAHATHCFKTDLRPGWIFRKLPGGGYWYLLYKYRRNLFDGMLRKYLRDYRLEQLPLPISTIGVDLVEAETIVRDSGDATLGILESINLPPLALPIFGAGRAMVDGGLLNNVPADVLASRDCNFVIASTVTAKLEKDFLGIRAGGSADRPRSASTLRTIMRQNLIQSHSMNAVGVRPADLVIAPDVTRFDLSEFTRADEMSVVGQEATRTTIDQLRRLLARLDPKLFPLPA